MQGFQWIDGSFVDAKPVPSDIDVVTFYESPAGTAPDVFDAHLADHHADLFDIDAMKSRFRCNPYPVALSLDARSLVYHTNYWYGLFCHDREERGGRAFASKVGSFRSDSRGTA